MSDYQNQPFRFANIGLDLRDAPDKITEGNWPFIQNIRSAREAQLQAREGLALDTSTGNAGIVHSIRRLDSTTKLIGAGTSLFRNNTLISTGWDGDPLSITIWRPSVSAEAWAYVTDGVKMRKVRADGTEFKWGVTAPVNAVTAAAGGAGNLNSGVAGGILYDWRATYFSSLTGAESNGSPVMATSLALTNQSANIGVTASTDPQVDEIRLYRRGGTITSGWRLSVTSGNVTGIVNDNVADSLIAANEPLSTTNNVPFTSVDAAGNVLFEVPLAFVWGPYAGKYLFGCGDPNRKGFLYWTNTQDPDSASTANDAEVTAPSEPLQSGFVYNGVPYVWSRDNLYVIDFDTQSATADTRQMPCGRGVVGPLAFTVGDQVYFCNKEGVFVTNGQNPSTEISKFIRPLFFGTTSLELGDIQPIDFSQSNRIRMAYWSQRVFMSYVDTQGAVRTLIYDTVYDRWLHWLGPFNMFYADENSTSNALFVGGNTGQVLQLDATQTTDNGTAFSVQVRTGSMDQAEEGATPHTFKEYGNLLIDADCQGQTITITPYINAEVSTLAPQTITGTGRQKYALSLVDTYAYSIAFQLVLPPPAIIYQMELLWRLDEEAVRHWEFPASAHEREGWQHVRDAYFMLRSTAPVTFTHTIDGVVHTYTLASTAGQKVKVYVPLDPVKGKAFRYALDSSADFRLYGEDCEIRLKEWNTKLGYKLLSPFAKQVSRGLRLRGAASGVA